MVFATLLFAGSEFLALWRSGSHQLWTALPVFVAVPMAYWLLRTGRPVAASVTIIGAIGLQSILSPLIQSGLGISTSIISLALIGGISFTTLPRQYLGRILAVGLTISLASVLIDLFGDPNRPIAELSQGRWIFSFLVLSVFAVFFAREFPYLDLRTKIIAGIIGTGAIALSVLIVFVLYQTRQVTSALSGRLDKSVNQLAEEQLLNRAFTQANQANQVFEDIAEEVSASSQHWLSLRGHQAVFSQGTYWDASQILSNLRREVWQCCDGHRFCICASESGLGYLGLPRSEYIGLPRLLCS